MPITTSAKKALRGSKRKRQFNIVRKDALKNEIKKVKVLVSTKKIEDAKAALSLAYQAIDKAKKRGLIKKNTAARKKSRLSALIARAK